LNEDDNTLCANFFNVTSSRHKRRAEDNKDNKYESWWLIQAGLDH